MRESVIVKVEAELCVLLDLRNSRDFIGLYQPQGDVIGQFAPNV